MENNNRKPNNNYKKDGFKKEFRKDGDKKFSSKGHFDNKKKDKGDFGNKRKPDFKRNDNKFDKKPNYSKGGEGFKKKTNDNFVKHDNKEEEQPKSNIRYYVYKCLYNIYFKDAYSNIEIDHIIRENDISELDAKLLTNIVYGTLSHDRLLNWEISKLSEKAPKDQAKVILLMSLYQMKFLDRIPEFAIINEAVSIAKKEGGEAMGKFVNAILRESQRQHLSFSEEDAKDQVEYLSIAYNMPIWVIKMLQTHYGKDKMIEILKDSIVEAPLSCRVNIHKSSVEEILQNPDFVKGNLANNSVIYKGDAPIATTKEMKTGMISVQDESSQYVVEVLNPQDNQNVLDMCAAPGSKTQYMAELMHTTGKVLAIDLHEHRVEIMKKYLKELGLTNTISVCYDSTKLHEKQKLIGTFDKVLLDAPCMGLGVIRRKPDIALGLKETSLDEIVALQRKLLDEAYLMLKVGGEMVYSTCSINKKENDSQVMEFIAKHPGMKRIYERQIFVSDYNSDGFYICKLVKEA